MVFICFFVYLMDFEDQHREGLVQYFALGVVIVLQVAALGLGLGVQC